MDPLAPLIASLQADGRPRVWSLVITVFGDSVRHRGGQIPAARLTRLLARIGIGSGAVRTALSRLGQDGWVTAKRDGRLSLYTLTEKGQAAFGPATRQIYAAPPAPVSMWTLSTDPAPDAFPFAGGWLRPADGTQTGARVTGTLAGPVAQAVLAGLDPAQARALSALAADLAAMPARCDPLAACAARTLLIHRWRRLVLRWPVPPPDLCPPDWPSDGFYAAVARAHTALSDGAEAWLDSAETDMPAMPPAAEGTIPRFAGLQRP